MRQALLLLTTLSAASSYAATPLPYSTRTLPFHAGSTTVRGDIRTVGMAGATVGLGDTFIASSENPAGLAMTLNGADLNFTSNWVHDNRIQDFNETLSTNNYGVAFTDYPAGFSLGFISPYRESARYFLPDTPPAQLTVTTREFRASAARLFAAGRLSLGMGLTLGQSEVESVQHESTAAFHSYTVGANFGAMFQLHHRILLGLSYSLPMTYAGDTSASIHGLHGLFQAIHVPGRFGLGVGWIPNRFFRSDFTLSFIGTTPKAALLRDETAIMGESLLVQPRAGVAYQLADFKDFSATLFLGTYYEAMRVPEASNRLHLTGGIEAKPWIFTIGWGLDASAGYKNYLITAGVDVFKVFQKLDLIPRPWQPPSGGFLPKPTGLSDAGLARPLVKNWRPQGPQMDAIQIGLEFPKRVEEKVEKTVKELKEGLSDFLQPEPKATPQPKQKPKSKPRPGKKTPARR